jgi:hypothetical protein
VGMRDNDLLHRQPMLLDNAENVIDLIARVDHHRFPALLVANDRAIALQNADRKYLVNHVFRVPRNPSGRKTEGLTTEDTKVREKRVLFASLLSVVVSVVVNFWRRRTEDHTPMSLW